MTHQEFKDAARQHQIDFKVNDHEINVPMFPQTDFLFVS